MRSAVYLQYTADPLPSHHSPIKRFADLAQKYGKVTDIQNLPFTVRNKASYIPWATRKAVTGKGEDTNIHDHARMDHTNTLAKVADDKTNKGQQSDEAAEKEDSKGNVPSRARTFPIH